MQIQHFCNKTDRYNKTNRLKQDQDVKKTREAM